MLASMSERERGPIPGLVTATPPGPMIAIAADGREVRFRRLALIDGRRVAIGSPVLLGDLVQRAGEWWAERVELDPARRAEHDALCAAQDRRIEPAPITTTGVIEAVDGEAVRVRLADGREVWCRRSKCRDHRGHLGLRVVVTLAPERVAAVAIAPEDIARNAALCKELEPKPIGPIRWPRDEPA